MFKEESMHKFSSSLMMCVCVCVRAAQLYLTLFFPMDYSLPGSFIHGISQVRILGWVAIFSARGTSQPRD